jgi:catechol 2,3-dioxygenase-like lactoylglutathione lyase family enzyme
MARGTSLFVVAPGRGGYDPVKEADLDMDPIEAQITFCYTDDLRRTSEFYEDILGLEMVLDQGGCRIYRIRDGAYWGFCEREGGAKPDGIVLTLVTPDVDAWYRDLSGRGVVFEKTPASNPRFGIYHCFLRDPNGYLLEIQRFDDPRWSSTRETEE